MNPISDAQFAIAAAQIRTTAALLEANIGRLRDSGQWRGPDADRFFREWESEVRGRLMSAATTLEMLVISPLV